MRRTLSLAWVIVLLLISAGSTVAQEPLLSSAGPDAVHLSVAVTDRSGRPVRGLTADQFAISVGGAPRPVLQFSAGRAPVSLGILLDSSGSMTKDLKILADERAQWAHVRRTLELLVTRLDAADEVFFAAFNEGVAAGPWTQDHMGLLREFDALRPGGGNALLSAVPEVLPTFELARYPRKVLLLITDGKDANPPRPGAVSSYPASDANPGYDALKMMGDSPEMLRQRRISITKNAVRRSDATLYAIGIGRRKGEPVDTVLLAGLTMESGGYVEPLAGPADVPAVVARIWDDLQSQYLLTFAAGPADGKYHPMKVTTKDARLRVRARAGYVAPSAAPILSP